MVNAVSSQSLADANTRQLACMPNRKPNASRVNETQGKTKISNTSSTQRTQSYELAIELMVTDSG